MSLRYPDQGELYTFVFLESVDEHAHAVVPQLHATIMQRCGKQRLRRVKGET